MGWLVIGLSIVIVILIVFLVLFYKEKEATAIRNTMPWQRHKLPLSFLSSGLLAKHYMDEFNEAIDFWGREIPDVKLFNHMDEIGLGEIIGVVFYETELEYLIARDGSDEKECKNSCAHSIAFTRLYMAEDKRITRASLHINEESIKDLSPEQIERTFKHELGHILTLKHDRDKSSVMYYRAIDSAPRVSEADKDWIRIAYK